MSKQPPVNPADPPPARRTGISAGSNALHGITPANSNTRVSAAVLPPRNSAGTGAIGRSVGNLGLNSDRMRAAMVQRLGAQGITDEAVLRAMNEVPRHRFVDEALASRAYEDAALPIGFGQTISQPWVVAHMIALGMADKAPRRVLEVGAGCGYQAAVLSRLVREVHAIERMRGLYDLARANLADPMYRNIRLVYGDGMAGLPKAAPFDMIIVAAAGLSIPDALLQQLARGGRLVAPEGGAQQRLVVIERTGPQQWRRQELDAVRFVPLKPGIQS